MEKMIRARSPSSDQTNSDSRSSQFSDTFSPNPSQDSDDDAQIMREFKNQFVVHNMQLKWDNSVRNVTLNYIHQVTRRQGFQYYMSQKAMSFLETIVKTQMAASEVQELSAEGIESEIPSDGQEITEEPTSSVPNEVEALIQHLLDDTENFIVPDEKGQRKRPKLHTTPTAFVEQELHLHDPIPAGVEALNDYIVKLIAPQVQLQSQSNPEAVIIMSAVNVQLKIQAHMDDSALDDEIGGLILQHFAIEMGHAQFFMAQKASLKHNICELLATGSYGSPDKSFWPPWLPLESIYAFDSNPAPFVRVVEKTSAAMRYDKYNQLRLQIHSDTERNFATGLEDDAGPGMRDEQIDNISVSFPRFIVTVDSAQYFALYMIIMDLLIYSEPLRKEQEVQLESIMLMADFTDLSGAPSSFANLQKRIRELEFVAEQFKLNADDLDVAGYEDIIAIDKEMYNYEDQLFLLMKAVTTSQHKSEERMNQPLPTMRWSLAAAEIIWHMLGDGRTPLLDVGLSLASFRRVDNRDSSNDNTVEIEMMEGVNLLPNALYTEVIAPFFTGSRTAMDMQRSKMVRVHWTMLEPIGGISMVDHFEVNMFPLRVQIEHDFGKRVFEYLFPDKRFLISAKQLNKNNSATLRKANDPDFSSESESETASKQSSNGTLTSPASTQSLSKLRHMHSGRLRAGDTSSISSKQTGRMVSHHSALKMVDEGYDHDLQQMLSRASSNLTLIYVKIPSVVLDFSYKVALVFQSRTLLTK